MATKKNKSTYVVRKCDGDYAVFKGSLVRKYDDIVPVIGGSPAVSPFRGYDNMPKEMAECIAERLSNELN